MQTESTNLPNKSTTHLEQRNANMVNDRLHGLTQAQLAKRYGIHISNVSRALSKEEAQRTLEQGQRTLVKLMPLAIARHKEMLARAGTKDKDRLAAIALYYKAMGIGPTHTLMQFNFYGDSKDGIDPKLRQIMSRIGATQEDIPDGEVINIE